MDDDADPFDPDGGREPARARRRRDRERMVSRARRAAASRLARPSRAVAPDPEIAADLERRGIAADWDSLGRLRESFARRNADHLASCSCWMCGNPRRMGEKSLRERAADAASEMEIDDLDD